MELSAGNLLRDVLGVDESLFGSRLHQGATLLRQQSKIRAEWVRLVLRLVCISTRVIADARSTS